jgi:hypothetical protein
MRQLLRLASTLRRLRAADVVVAFRCKTLNKQHGPRWQMRSKGHMSQARFQMLLHRQWRAVLRRCTVLTLQD